jgi:hypothetical protein
MCGGQTRAEPILAICTAFIGGYAGFLPKPVSKFGEVRFVRELAANAVPFVVI